MYMYVPQKYHGILVYWSRQPHAGCHHFLTTCIQVVSKKSVDNCLQLRKTYVCIWAYKHATAKHNLWQHHYPVEDKIKQLCTKSDGSVSNIFFLKSVVNNLLHEITMPPITYVPSCIYCSVTQKWVECVGRSIHKVCLLVFDFSVLLVAQLTLGLQNYSAQVSGPSRNLTEIRSNRN